MSPQQRDAAFVRPLIEAGAPYAPGFHDDRPEGPENRAFVMTDVPGETWVTEEDDGNVVIENALVTIADHGDNASSIIVPRVMAPIALRLLREPGTSVRATGHVSSGYWIVKSMSLIPSEGPCRTEGGQIRPEE